MANLDIHAGPGGLKRLGPYRLVRPIGQTGLGAVHLGETAGGHLVVLKVLPPELADDPERSGRFAREVAAARRVSGLYTAAILDADPDGPEPWLATQYIPGPTLRAAVAERGPLPAPSLAALGAGLAEGLAAIHAAGVVHRDLKPSHVILAPDGPRIIDFGIARLTDAPEFTRPGMFLGTPAYASPEQVDGALVGPASDIFSLGGVLTFAATGHEPFPADSPAAQLYGVRTGEPDLHGVPDIIAPLVTSCLAKDPARRSTAAGLVEAFRALGTRELGADSTGPSRNWPGDTTDHVAGYAAPAAPAAPAPPAAAAPDIAQDQSSSLETAVPWDNGQPLQSVADDDGDDHRSADDTRGYDYFSPPEPGDTPDPEHGAARGYGWSELPPSQTQPAPAAAGRMDEGGQDSPGYDEPSGYGQPVYSESGSGGTRGPGGEPAAEPSAGRFLTGVLPERAPSGTKVSLLVLVTLGGIPDGSAAMKVFPVSPEGTTVTITVSAPGLVSLGDLDQDLTVPFATDSEPVRFGFLAGQAGLHTVAVRVFAGGTCLGELSLQISVETGAILEEGRPQTAPMTGLAAEPGEVTLQVSRTASGGYSFQLLSEALYPVVLIDRLAGDPASVVAKIAAELRMMAGDQSQYATAAHARNRLRALGTELWADVVPEAIRRQFWAQRDGITLFTIATDMDTVPWELVYPVDLENEDGFLVEQFPLVRRAYGQGRARTLRLDSGVGFIVPPRAPANALDEVTAVRGILPANVADRGVEAGLPQVLGLLDAMPSVLHFAGHNAFTEEAGSVISLDGGSLCPDDLASAMQKRAFAAVSPLVFLNGCRTAGEIAGFSQMNGWAERFMGAGAGAFIGSLWAVRSSSAKAFAEEFYRELVTRKQPLGTASLRARQAIAADGGDPTWLAYTVYGNPSAAVDE
jgi:serine/threonine protein kinase